jgi:FkbM family methyltransferase
VPVKQVISAAAKSWISKRGPVATRIAKECRRYLRKYDNDDFHIETNGELWLMSRMAGAQVVFDVGANTGKWSLLCASMCPLAEIHAFEILPATYEKLVINVSDHDRIKPNSIGLAEACGSVAVIGEAGHDDLTSCVGAVRLMHEDVQFEEHSVRVRTGDDYCAEHGIAKIDFLKIDTEGAEYAILLGFKRMLEGGRIDVIQFEYGLPNILSRKLVRDFHELLAPLGYRIGKLYPEKIEFRPWHPNAEERPGPNYVATLIHI